MNRIMGALTLLALMVALAAPALFAQEERGEISVFADYTRLHHLNDANFWGVGGLLGVNLNHHMALEGSMAYDFEQNFTSTSGNNLVANLNTTFVRSGLRLLNGVFGPKFQTGIGPVKAFAVLKGGFLNFGVSNNGPVTGFTGAVNNVPNGDTNGVFYPGGGIEFFARRIGIRAEIGDLMYFDNGANHNLKFTVGPVFRF